MPNTLQLQVHEYTPGRRQGAHDHDEVHVSIVLRGTVTETVGGVTEHAGALSVVVKDRGVRHTNQFGSRGATLARLAFRDRGVSDLLDDSRRVVEWKWSHRLVAVAPFLRLVARHGRGEGGIDANDADVVDLLAVLSARRDTQRADTPPAWLVDALTWLRLQWHPALGVSDVAGYANVHPVYLARCVRRWYGHSVGDELRRLRLGSAAQGVAFRAGDLSQVAFDNGYADQAHFCREFRRATGVTPGTYRATVRELTALTAPGDRTTAGSLSASHPSVNEVADIQASASLRGERSLVIEQGAFTMVAVAGGALIVSAIANLQAAAAQGVRPPASELAKAVDSLAAHVVASGLAPAIGVAVVMDGKTILEGAHGFADATNGIRADARTLWYIASTSKSITGFATSLLAHDGVIRLDAPITGLLPRAEWHAEVRPERLTLAEFLSHTHGLNSGAVVMSAAFTGIVPEVQWPQLLVWSAPLATKDLIYSNLGYNVAAMVIDAHRPEGWRRFTEQRVFAPAGMSDTYARVSGLDARRIAKPHTIDATGRYSTARFFKTDATMNSAGGHLATLHDLARWVAVQMDSGRIDGRQVFPQSAVALSHRMIARHTRPDAKRFAYFDRHGWGAGWDVGAYEGEAMVSRFGSYHTTRSHLSFLPHRRIGVVVETTGRSAWTTTDVIAAFAYDLEAGRRDARARAEQRLRSQFDRLTTDKHQAAARDSVRRVGSTLSASALAALAGRYSHPGYGTVVITSRDGGLYYEWGALDGPVDVIDAAKRQVRLEIAGAGAQVQFADAGGGPASAVQLRGITFSRVRSDR